MDVEETEVPTKDAVRMVKPNMVELKCFLFFFVVTTSFFVGLSLCVVKSSLLLNSYVKK